MPTSTDWTAEDGEWIASGQFERLEKPWYRMPVGFGSAPGPRNLPLGKGQLTTQLEMTSYRVTALTDEGALRRLLPPGVRLRGDPEVTVGIGEYRNVYWLAGLSYRGMSVSIQVTATRGAEAIEGTFYTCAWHNIPDNVMTAREELGWPTSWADIGDPIRRGPDAYTADASWMGFRFFELEIDGLGQQQEEPAANEIQITYKYIPKGYAEGADVDKLIVNDLSKYWNGAGSVKGAEAGKQLQSANTVRQGTGRFRFHRARWEDMPTQYLVINRLADLPLLEFRSARVSATNV